MLILFNYTTKADWNDTIAIRWHGTQIITV